MGTLTRIINDLLNHLPPSTLLDGTAMGRLVYWVTVSAAFLSMGTFIFFLFRILRKVVRGCIYGVTTHFIPGYSIGAIRARINVLEKALSTGHELSESPVKLTAFVGRFLVRNLVMMMLTLLLAMAPLPPLFRLPLIAGPLMLVIWRGASVLEALDYIRDPKKNGADVLDRLAERLGKIRQKTSLPFSILIDRELERVVTLKESMISAGKLPPHGRFRLSGKVSHTKFGEGRVVSVDGDRIGVEFEKFGKKTILASFLLIEEEVGSE